jgi:cytochrome c556
MKTNVAPAVASEDAPTLANDLDYIAAHAPAGMPNWTTIAKTGAARAAAGDIAGAKASCKSCHDQYKAKYKAEMRDRAF